MRFLVLLAFAAFVILGSTTSTAQNIALDPAYGSVSLTGGFDDDPHVVSMTAGGSNQIGDQDNCFAGGLVADAPDYNLHYTANGDWTLSIGAISDGDTDTMILVNLPDGSWRCDDDSFGDLDPILSFSNPRSGLYNIWVGTIGNEFIEAQLIITERDLTD